MAWTAPMTAVANTPFTAALYNTQIRDNMRMQAPYLTGSAGDVFVVQSANTIVSKEIEFHEVVAPQTTTSSSYTDLSTVGPTITCNVEGHQAMVWISAELDQNTLNLQASVAVEVSGATSYAASDTRCAMTRDGLAASNPVQYMGAFLFDPLNSGEHTFTMKYRNGGSGTVTAANRRMMVWPL